MPKYVFQESRIWEAGNPVDPDGKVFKTKRKTLERARKALPENSSIGRRWVLISVDGTHTDRKQWW